jgi:dihydrofolate synthase/folylpolyglutamate synthase
MTYAEALSRLYALEHSGIKLGLSRIRSALERVGHPERAFASIHVAGTNGKGSVCAMLSGILQASGYRTGLYTSPHLLEFRERIRVDGRMVSPEEVVQGLEALWPAVREYGLSFFEATTLLAFWCFARRGVQVAVLEVGLGGRLDATNVVHPEVTLITSLALDHQKTLGPTLEAIAGEKAGILKPGVPLILATTSPEGLEACRRRAGELGVPVWRDREWLRVSRVAWDWRGTRWSQAAARPGLPRWLEDRWETGLAGIHQAENARLALLAAAVLADRGWRVAEESCREGLAQTRWPGRVESLEPRWPVVLDVAHNPEGIRALVRTLGPLCRGRPLVWVVGMVRGKDHAAVFRTLARLGGPVHVARPSHERGVGAEVLAAAARAQGLEVRVHARVTEALEAALEALPPRGLCVVTGSFFTYDEAARHLGLQPVEELHAGARAVR